jgi:hypothetical protein
MLKKVMEWLEGFSLEELRAILASLEEMFEDKSSTGGAA